MPEPASESLAEPLSSQLKLVIQADLPPREDGLIPFHVQVNKYYGPDDCPAIGIAVQIALFRDPETETDDDLRAAFDDVFGAMAPLIGALGLVQLRERLEAVAEDLRAKGGAR